MDFDTGAMASFDRISGLRTRWVVEADQASEGEITLYILSRRRPVARRTSTTARIVFAACKCKNTKTLGCQCFHDLEGFVLQRIGKVHNLTVVPYDRDAGVNDSLHGTLGIDMLILGFTVLEDHRHLLDIRIEGIFADLLELRSLTVHEAVTVAVESRSEDLESNFCGISQSRPLALVVLVDPG